MQFDGAAMAKATKNYSKRNLIGRGGFGSVYQGSMRGGLKVAVKILTQVCG